MTKNRHRPEEDLTPTQREMRRWLLFKNQGITDPRHMAGPIELAAAAFVCAGRTEQDPTDRDSFFRETWDCGDGELPEECSLTGADISAAAFGEIYRVLRRFKSVDQIHDTRLVITQACFKMGVPEKEMEAVMEFLNFSARFLSAMDKAEKSCP